MSGAGPHARGGGLAVLSFHRVVDVPQEGHDVSWPSFRDLLDHGLPANGRPSTDLSPAGLLRPGVVLTFDDGTADHLRVAEELAARGMKGIFFISAGRVGADAMLGVDELRRIAGLGHVVGSHGIDHIPLDRLDPHTLSRELRESKEKLEAIVGLPVLHYAFAGGIHTPEALSLLPGSGYQSARTMSWGFYRDASRRWTVPSLPVTELTLQRGWIKAVVQDRRIPTAMALTGYAKVLIPRDLRQGVRRIAQRLLVARR